MRWFLALSIRWKLQIGFFMVTMVTTIFNRLLASNELGKMTEIARINNVATDVIQQLQASHDAYIFNSFWESGLEFLIQFFIIGVVATIFVRPIRGLCNALKSVQNGDLTKEVPVTSLDEIGILENSFNNMLRKLNEIMRSVQDSGKGMGQSAFQISKISREISEVSRDEERRSEEVSEATAKLHAISESVKLSAQKGMELARETEQRAKQGTQTVQLNIEQMNQTASKVNRASTEISELAVSAEKINIIVNTISTIADQTNLLSLNAAIEAARAGDAGRGFAVVADEVRNLAVHTSSSLGEIKTIVETLTGKVGQVSETMDDVVKQVTSSQDVAEDTRNTIKEMGEQVSESATANNEIFDASHSQLEHLEQLRQTLDKLYETLAESSSKVDTTSTIGEHLLGVTEQLNGLLAEFTFEHDASIERGHNEQRNHPRLTEHLLVSLVSNGSHLEGVSSDFSLTGIQIKLTEPIPDKENVIIEIFKPCEDVNKYGNQNPLKFKAKVKWERSDNGRYYYGIQYEELSHSHKKFIQECFQYYNKNQLYTDSVSGVATC
ncbi:MAG: methyl-accepting chemotaxis protein [Thiohalomonadales bacterium]